MDSSSSASRNVNSSTSTPSIANNSPQILWNPSNGHTNLARYIYQQVYPNEEFDNKQVHSNMQTIFNCYSSVITNVRSTKAAFLKNGNYRCVWRKFIKYLQEYSTKDNEHLFLSPGSCGEDNTPCAPWVFKERAEDFLSHLAVNTIITHDNLKKYMALNFLIKNQNDLIETILMNKVQPLPKMKQKHGRAGAALSTAKEKTLLQYKAAPLAQNQKKKTQQSDPQRGHVCQPFSDTQLIKINEWFFSKDNVSSEFKAATLRFLFGWSHFGLMRGDDLRTTGMLIFIALITTSYAHLNKFFYAMHTQIPLGHILASFLSPKSMVLTRDVCSVF